MFKSKKELTERRMPTAEEFALWGAYELSFEELLAVNGGKREKKEKSGKSSGGGKPSKSSGGGGGSSKGFFGSGSKKSSGWGTKSKETNKEKKTKTQTGTTGTERRKNGNGASAGGGLKGGEPKSKEEKKSRGAEYTVRKGDTLSDIVRKQYPGASKEEIVRRVKEAAANSGIKDIDKIEPGQKILFEKPAQSSSGQPNTGEATSPTQGGSTRRGSRPPSNSGLSGSFTNTSSGESSGGSYSGGGRSGYHPPPQSQPAPKPSVQQGQENGLPQKPNPAEPALPEECKQDMLGKNNTPLNLNKPDFKPVYDNYGRFLGYGDEAEKRKLDLQKAPSLDASFSIGGSIVVLQGYAGFNISQDYSGAVDVDPKLSADIGVFAPGVTATVSLGASLPGNEGAKTQELNLNILGFGGAVAFSEKGITSFSLSISANAGYQGDKSDMGVGYNLFKR